MFFWLTEGAEAVEQGFGPSGRVCLDSASLGLGLPHLRGTLGAPGAARAVELVRSRAAAVCVVQKRVVNRRSSIYIYIHMDTDMCIMYIYIYAFSCASSIKVELIAAACFVASAPSPEVAIAIPMDKTSACAGP